MRSALGRRARRRRALPLIAAGLAVGVCACTAPGGGPGAAHQAAPITTTAARGASAVGQAERLVASMTLAQKIMELHGITGREHQRYVPGIPSLGIPPLVITNGPAGVGPGDDPAQQRATALPAPISLAASFDTALAYSYGAITGREAADLGANVVEGPDVNIIRVPRGGRTFESLSEDPYLTAAIGTAQAQGIQAAPGMIAEVKHFVAYSQETNRGLPSDDNIVSARVLHEIYLPPFDQALTKGGAAGLMCGYALVNGQWSCQDEQLLSGVVAGKWGFQGLIQSDFGATRSTVGSATAGLNLEMQTGGHYGTAPIEQALAAGTLSITTVNRLLTARLTAMIRRGLIGGSSHVDPLLTVSPVRGIEQQAGRGTSVSYVSGTDLAAAVAAARRASAVVVMVGDTESEGKDQPSLSLPGGQDQLVAAVARANPRTVVVVKSGNPVLMPWLGRVPAVVEAWYPGEEDGAAVAAVLFGAVDPSGKLPVTFPASESATPVSTAAQFPGVDGRIEYSEGLDVGYRGYDAEHIAPLFPFGYGLSYTTFRFSDLAVSPGCGCDGQGRTLATVTATVTNTGPVAGAEVAQLHLGDPRAALEPPRQLKGFARVSLAPGQSAAVSFPLTGHDLSYWDDAGGGWVVPPGTFTIYVGDSSALAGLPLRAHLTITS